MIIRNRVTIRKYSGPQIPKMFRLAVRRFTLILCLENRKEKPKPESQPAECSSSDISLNDRLAERRSRDFSLYPSAAGFGLKLRTLDSRNCSSYSCSLCLIRNPCKRSNFTKPANVSLRSPADRNKKEGDANKLPRGGGSWKQGFLEQTR